MISMTLMEDRNGQTLGVTIGSWRSVGFLVCMWDFMPADIHTEPLLSIVGVFAECSISLSCFHVVQRMFSVGFLLAL